MLVLKDVIKISKIKGGTVEFLYPLVLPFFVGGLIMLVNKDSLEREEINSRVHKVRAVIQDYNGNIYVTNMDDSYNLPGGRVENKEDLKKALKRELKEELGINVTYGEMEYVGNIIFWHKGFPGEKGVVNRENNVDLFVIDVPKEVNMEKVKLTNYEKHYHFHLMECSLKQIDALLKEKNDNEYKNFIDVELDALIQEYKKYRKEDKYVG